MWVFFPEEVTVVGVVCFHIDLEEEKVELGWSKKIQKESQQIFESYTGWSYVMVKQLFQNPRYWPVMHGSV